MADFVEDAFVVKWVNPYYMNILHGNYICLEEPERTDFPV